MSILTYKLKHNRDFSLELKKARQIAKFALRTKSRSSKDVKEFGLPSYISNQILKKYSSNKKLKAISNVKLTIPSMAIKISKNTLKIKCINLELDISSIKNFIKVNQVELDNQYAFISVEIKDKTEMKTKNFLGVDRNTTGHCAVVAIPQTGKVIKLGKECFHVHRKYKQIRKHLQSKNAKKKLKRISKREKNIIKNLNHKIANKIVQLAIDNKCGIKLEKLTGIRKQGERKTRKNKSGESFKSSINTWEFYQLGSMIAYKSKICGVPVMYINPQYTSQKCSRCGVIGNRNGKVFTCINETCNHVDHADSNAGFNIALSPALELSNQKKEVKECIDQSVADRISETASVSDNDATEGSTDAPQLETQLCLEISKVA